MNNHGCVLDDFGLAPTMAELMRTVVQPLATLAGYADVGGDELRTHHAFVVAYALGKDLDLSFHVDSADVTLNVCLGKDFEGGDFIFNDPKEGYEEPPRAEDDDDEESGYGNEPGVSLAEVSAIDTSPLTSQRLRRLPHSNTNRPALST